MLTGWPTLLSPFKGTFALLFDLASSLFLSIFHIVSIGDSGIVHMFKMK